MLARTLQVSDVVNIGSQQLRLSSIDRTQRNCIISIGNVDFLLVEGDAIDVEGGYMVIPEINYSVRCNFHVDKDVKINHIKKGDQDEPVSTTYRFK